MRLHDHNTREFLHNSFDRFANGRGSICFEKMASALWTVSLPAHHRVALVSLLLSLGLLSSQAQGAFPCVTTLLTSDVFGRCTNISLAALKSAPAALFGHEVSQYTQL